MPKLNDLIFMLIRGFIAKKAIQQAKKKGVLIYLKTLQAVRMGLAGSLLAFVFLQLMILGLIGSIVTAVLLSPQDLNTKLYILLAVFAALFLIPFAIVLFIFSEQVWYKLSGAEKMVNEIKNQ